MMAKSSIYLALLVCYFAVFYVGFRTVHAANVPQGGGSDSGLSPESINVRVDTITPVDMECDSNLNEELPECPVCFNLFKECDLHSCCVTEHSGFSICMPCFGDLINRNNPKCPICEKKMWSNPYAMIDAISEAIYSEDPKEILKLVPAVSNYALLFAHMKQDQLLSDLASERGLFTRVAESGSSEQMAALLQTGLPGINYPDQSEFTPLYYSLSRLEAEPLIGQQLLDLLLDCGRVNFDHYVFIDDNHLHIIYHAIEVRAPTVFERILCDANEDWSAVLQILAGEHGMLEFIKTLVEKVGPFDYHAINRDGKSALYIASSNSCLDSAMFLVDLPGLDENNVNIPMFEGRTLLHDALMRGHKALVERLAAIPGIKWDIPDATGVTPAMLIAKRAYDIIPIDTTQVIDLSECEIIEIYSPDVIFLSQSSNNNDASTT